jgi:hypothetical protein
VNAPELLAAVRRRGATAWREIGDDGTAVLVIAPREAIGDLLPELARFKPALLELLTQPDARQLAREVTLATRGQWLTPQQPLLVEWKRFNAHFGANITSQQIGAIARLIEENPQLDNDELLTQIGAQLRQGETT